MTKQELNEMLSKLYDAMEAAGLDGTTLADASLAIHEMNTDDGERDIDDNAEHLTHVQWQQAGGL